MFIGYLFVLLAPPVFVSAKQFGLTTYGETCLGIRGAAKKAYIFSGHVRLRGGGRERGTLSAKKMYAFLQKKGLEF